ncbi:MAG: hypothetical protein OEW33_11800 [Nitrospirota bacterium]|nr:hypothetical protein [Nitrospirota bacterium]
MRNSPWYASGIFFLPLFLLAEPVVGNDGEASHFDVLGSGWAQILRLSPCPEPFGFAQDRLRRMDQDDHAGRQMDARVRLSGMTE